MFSLADIAADLLPFNPEWLEGFPTLTVHDWISEEVSRG